MCVETAFQSGTWYLGWVVAVVSVVPPIMRVVYADGDDLDCVSWAPGKWRAVVPQRSPSLLAMAAFAQRQ